MSPNVYHPGMETEFDKLRKRVNYLSYGKKAPPKNNLPVERQIDPRINRG